MKYYYFLFINIHSVKAQLNGSFQNLFWMAPSYPFNLHALGHNPARLFRRLVSVAPAKGCCKLAVRHVCTPQKWRRAARAVVLAHRGQIRKLGQCQPTLVSAGPQGGWGKAGRRQNGVEGGWREGGQAWGMQFWQLCQILTPIPVPLGLAWTSQICAIDFAGADPRSPIGAAVVYPGLRRKYPFTPPKVNSSCPLYCAGHSTGLLTCLF